MSGGRTGGPVESTRTAFDQDPSPSPSGPWPGFGATPPAIAAAGSAGSSPLASRSDHTHAMAFNAVSGTGPTALGTVGTGTLAGHSDQTHASYRSDTLSTTWSIDTVNGSDAATNPGTSNATALKTWQELKRRWWHAEVTANTTVTILGSAVSSDSGTWNTAVKPGVTVTITGSLGATTGFGGAPIDNTVLTGTVTAFTAAGNTPAADDIEMTDSAIPVSWTASGAMATRLLFKRTSSTALYWYALKDLGSKTLRISPPMLNSGVAMASAVLVVGDAYALYSPWTYPAQDFGHAHRAFKVDSLTDLTATAVNAQNVTLGQMYDRSRVWCDMATNSTTRFFTGRAVNCMFEVNQFATITSTPLVFAFSSFAGGAARSVAAGGGQLSIFGTMEWSGSATFQSVFWNIDEAKMQVTQPIAFFDNTSDLIHLYFNSQLAFASPTVGGVSGKGNTAKIINVSNGWAQLSYGFSSRPPPFEAATTTDPNPIVINGTSYPVSAMPTTAQTQVIPGTIWPNNPTLPLPNGVQAVTIGATGPGGIGTPATAAGWETFYDSTGALCYRPFWK